MGIEGIIRPPPEIRAVADKTASYVAKNGRAFESRILGSGKGKTPKFAFLQPTSPFHAYYEDRIRFYEEGGEDKKEEDDETKAADGDDNTTEDAADKKQEEQKKKEQAKKKKGEKSQKSSAAIDPVAKALLAQRGQIAQARAKFQEETKEKETPPPQQPAEGQPEGVPPPPPPRKQYYTPPAPPSLELVQIVAPASLTIAQVETIQLVAQFTAMDGKGGPFFTKLQRREWANPAFSFCQPRHGHFAYFSALVDAYRRMLDNWTSEMPGDGIDELANNVDKCLETAAYRVEYERDLEEQARKKKAEAGDAVPDVAQIDWHDFVVVETIDFPADEKVELVMLPPPLPKASSSPPTTTTNSALGGDLLAAGAASGGAAAGDMDESDDEDGETIRVVPSYTPRVVSTQQTNAIQEVIDPITGKSVAVKDMPEHMRIQLLDPRWAEERKKFQEKQKDSNLVSGDVVASNISRLARDTFGTTGRDLLSGETDSKKRLEEANRIIREQSQRGVGPSLPPPVRPAARASLPPPPPPNFPPPPPPKRPLDPRLGTAEEEPAAKKQRLEGAQDPRLAPAAAAVPAAPENVQAPPNDEGGMPADPTTGDNDSELMSAEDFVKTLSKPEVTLQVRIPNDPAQMAWNFYGQIVPLTVDVNLKVKAVKQELSRLHLNAMPPNKIQLKSSKFLKDSATLAALNIGPTATLDLVPKTRGGRK